MKPILKQAVAMVQIGATYTEAARAFGLTRSAVAGACNRAGVKVGFRPAQKSELLARMKRLHQDPAFREKSYAAASENAKRLHAIPGYSARLTAASNAAQRRKRANLQAASVESAA